MQGILNERAMLYELIENIKMNNPEEQTSKAMKILTDAIYYGKDTLKQRVKRTIYKYQSYNGDYKKLNTSDLKKLLEKIKSSSYKSATEALRESISPFIGIETI